MSRDQAKQQRERRHLKQAMAGWLGASPPPIDYRGIASTLVLSPERTGSDRGVGRSGLAKPRLGRDPSELLQKAIELVAALNLLKAKAEAIGAALADSQLYTLGQLDQASALTARILTIEPTSEHWLTIPAIDELEARVGECVCIA